MNGESKSRCSLPKQALANLDLWAQTHYTLHSHPIYYDQRKEKQERDSFKSARLKILEICLVWIICAKFHNNLTKDEKVMVKCFDFGQELREK